MRGKNAAVALVVAGVAAFVSAAAADPPTTTLHGCTNADNGLLKLVAEGTACDDGWEAISWLVEGPAGEAGVPGEPGVKGPDGDPGPDGADAVVPESVEVDVGGEAAASFDGESRTLRVTVPRGLEGPVGEQGAEGAEGPAGPFSGHFESANGLMTIDVTDAGIVLDAGSSEVRINASTVSVNGLANVSLTGGLVTLNGGCRGVARLLDSTTPRLIFGPFGQPIWLPATIATASTTVLSC